jgi:Uma2 family endonuclease
MIAEIFPTFTLQLGRLKEKISDDDYFELCQLNELLVIERDKNGDFEIRSLGGGFDGIRSAALSGEIGKWAKDNNEGVCFGALTGFTLPNGAVRAPGFAWLKREKWQKLSDEQKEKFANVCPDFVVELSSPAKPVEVLKAKMQEYIENGVSLGWLIDPTERKVYIYRPDQRVETLENPAEISGASVLKGFVLNLKEIW